MSASRDPFLKKIKDPSHIRAYRHIAKQLGDTCMTTVALKEYDQRISVGRNADIVKVGNSLVVVDF